MTARNRELLILHFVECKEFGEIKDIMGVSLRTVFRYYDKVLQSFAIMLNATGYAQGRIEEEYRDEPFFIRMKKRVLDTQRVNIERGLRKQNEQNNDKGVEKKKYCVVNQKNKTNSVYTI